MAVHNGTEEPSLPTSKPGIGMYRPRFSSGAGATTSRQRQWVCVISAEYLLKTTTRMSMIAGPCE
ncbi:hypothetical protein LY76DRAFT_249915 [Colletotrichum caudatum]|nr:hypothetical protein LY76DRAFT_249915 [Colletotrichum caudatum]